MMVTVTLEHLCIRSLLRMQRHIRGWFMCVVLGDAVPGGAQAGPQGSGSTERPGQVSQSHQDHRLRPGSPAGREREGV